MGPPNLGIMVQGNISYKYHLPLVFVERMLNGMYAQNIVQPILQQQKDGVLFHQHNTCPHEVCATQHALQDIQTLFGPAQLLNLFLFEYNGL